MAVTVDLKLDIVDLLRLVGSWVAGITANNRARTDSKIRNSIPVLVTKMSVLAGQKLSLVNLLDQPGSDAGRLNTQLNLMKKSLSEIVELIRAADPLFAVAHPELMTQLSMTIDTKMGLMLVNGRADLSEEKTRADVAIILASEAKLLQDIAGRLSSTFRRSN